MSVTINLRLREAASKYGILENFILRNWQLRLIDGVLCFDTKVFDIFLCAPFDILPSFQGPLVSKSDGGRDKHHRRYERFIYSFARYYKPNYVVEVGTLAGATAIAWAKAIVDNGKGKLICVDDDGYSKGTYPLVTKNNLTKIMIDEGQYSLLNGNAREIIPNVSKKLPHEVDIYLVDGDHTYFGALANMEDGLSMMKTGGFILVHDVDRKRKMNEMTKEHRYPVYEAFMKIVDRYKFEWCILQFISRHLGIIRVR